MRLASSGDRSSKLWIRLVWYQESQRICLKTIIQKKTCNPAQTQWHRLVGSGVKVFFCDPSPPGLFRQMMEGRSQRSTPRPPSHSPHVLRLPRQHARAWHFIPGHLKWEIKPLPTLLRMNETGTCTDWFSLVARYWSQDDAVRRSIGWIWCYVVRLKGCSSRQVTSKSLRKSVKLHFNI